MDSDDRRLPLPSEDEGDLFDAPPEGMTDDPLIATEEGVPYDPPSDRVLSDSRGAGGPDYAGIDPSDAGELDRDDDVQQDDALPARDDELRADVIEALRASDVPAGDHIRVGVAGSRVVLAGEVESIDVAEELLGIAGDVEGVTDVVDELEIPGV